MNTTSANGSFLAAAEAVALLIFQVLASGTWKEFYM